jgi:hypothetical protein
MAIAGNTPVPVPNGWVLAKHLNKGDYVFSSEGKPIQIVSTHEYTPTKCYTITLNDNCYLDIDNHTKLPVSDVNRRWVENRYQGKRKQTAVQKYASPEELLEKGLHTARGERMFSINNAKPVHFLWEDHPVPPFIAGMWMTKRNSRGRFMPRPEVLEYIQKKIRSFGWNYVMDGPRTLEIRPSINHAFITKYPTVPRTLPPEYCFGSIEQRIELLQGFLAIRPNCFNKKRKAFEVCARDIRFLIMVQGICESLGMKTHVFNNETSLIHKLRFKTDIPLVPWQEFDVISRNATRRMIKKVELIKPTTHIHIKTEQPFLVGQGFLPVWH